MPFKSKAQQRFMFAAESRGELPKGTARRWAEETDFEDLPEKVSLSLAHAHDSGRGIAPAKIHEGQKVEMEHTKEPATAKQIAIDHLRERQDYYDLLKEVENAKKTGSYKLEGELKFQGLDIAIETDKGSKRHWKDPHSNTKGFTLMKFPYGYIRGSEGTDGDHVDVYVGPKEDAPKVYIVNQMKAPHFKEFDEQKCMLGFDSMEDAKKAYLDHYDNPKFLGSITEMPFEEFKQKVTSKKNHGKKIAEAKIAMSPAALSALRHSAIGGGLGAAAGGIGGALHSNPENRAQGALRGALVGGSLGALGGAAVSGIKGHSQRSLEALRAATAKAEEEAVAAHVTAKRTPRPVSPAVASTERMIAPRAPQTTDKATAVLGKAPKQDIANINTQAQALMTPEAWGGGLRQAPATAVTEHDLAQLRSAALGGGAAALREATLGAERGHQALSRAVNRAALVGAGAGTGLMGYMAVPQEHGGVGLKSASDDRVSRIADRLDDVGIGVLAAPYVAKSIGGRMARAKNTKIRAAGTALQATLGPDSAFGHSSDREVLGLGLVAPGIVHGLAKGINKVAPKKPEPMVMKTAENVGKILAGTKLAGVGRLALGLGAVGTVAGGLYGAKKGIDAAKHIATSRPPAVGFQGVRPGLPPPVSV